MAWNDWAGNIWITTALSLPNFQPPRKLISKKHEQMMNWYPNIIHKSLGNDDLIESKGLYISSFVGDRLGDNTLHMYWREFPHGVGPTSNFKKMKFEIFDIQQP